MNAFFIKEADFTQFLGNMIGARKVIGPKARKNRFVFDQIRKPEDLRLDYDVTILPPKKVFFPPRQELIRFHGQKGSSCIQPESTVLFGVHFYDIKAIDMTDHLFRENNMDFNYLAQRECTTLIGSNVQNIFKRAFFGSVGKGVAPKGHDGFTTKISGGYLYEVYTAKGKDLLAYGTFIEATEEQINEAREVNDSVMDKCPEKINHDSLEISEKVRSKFNSPVWEEFAHDCFSCGSCNLVCPTCYCFDVQDNWNVDQVTGSRDRTWDGCLLEDFSSCSLTGGSKENFRETRGSRYRHRIMRKTSYLTAKLGGPACVGCGRCSSSCTADIADPVNVINRLMEE
ncbi:MAG: 4Fe-4S dicluster domain-containing protein [Deltaproteobacteria bacterium]|nr:4Fe-4S dicluster domain-containing protein [Deltaproteobacteria bacterium]